MTSIKYGSLTISNLRNSSGLFVGTNLQKGQKNEIVINEGFGTINGKNRVKSNTGVVEKHS